LENEERKMSRRFEHCKLEGTRITYLGRAGVFEDKRDRTASAFRAWAYLEDEGWELVAVLNEMGQHVAYFKRPAEL
jgi:hypothetical protein